MEKTTKRGRQADPNALTKIGVFLGFWMEAELGETLKQEATKRHMSKAALMRELVRKLQEEQS